MEADQEATGATSRGTPRERGALKKAAGWWVVTWLTYTISSQPSPIAGWTKTSWTRAKTAATAATGARPRSRRAVRDPVGSAPRRPSTTRAFTPSAIAHPSPPRVAGPLVPHLPPPVPGAGIPENMVKLTRVSAACRVELGHSRAHSSFVPGRSAPPGRRCRGCSGVGRHLGAEMPRVTGSSPFTCTSVP